MYSKRCFPAFQQKLRDEGKSEEEIETKVKWRRRRNTKILQNKSLRRKGSQEDGPAPIIWDADDPSVHSFELLTDKDDPKSGTMTTIAAYFKERHNMPLNYPHLPAIFIKDGRQDAYFPIEFLFQAFGKVKGVDMNKHLLKFNDDFASTHRVTHLETACADTKRVMAQPGQQSVATLLEQFHLSVHNEPMVLCATILKQPRISLEIQP